MSQKPQITIAQMLMWTTAVAFLMAYFQTMPLGTMIPDRSLSSLVFTFFFSALGGIGLAGFVWFLPSVIRGDVRKRAPGELLLMASGVIVFINCTVLPWAASQHSPESLDFYRMYISVYCAFAVPLFIVVAVVYHGRIAWKLALMAPSLAYAVWGLATFLDRQCGGLGYFWYGNRNIMSYLQFLSPIFAAIPIAYAVFGDFFHHRRPAAHWLGVVLFLIIGGQTLHFAGWHRMFGLLLPKT